MNSLRRKLIHPPLIQKLSSESFLSNKCYQYNFRITNYYTERGKTLIGPILTKYQFTDVEYAFLFALSIWQIGMILIINTNVYHSLDPDQCMPDNIVSLSDICRKQLFEALQLYYQDQLKLSDYSVRLGNLTTFEHVIQVRFDSLHLTYCVPFILININCVDSRKGSAYSMKKFKHIMWLGYLMPMLPSCKLSCKFHCNYWR